MVSTEEIAVRVYELLTSSAIPGMITGVVDFQRTDYTREDVIIVPHVIEGEGSVRFGQIKVNIHVPDLIDTSVKHTANRTNFKRLVVIRREVIAVLKSYYETECGYSWTIGMLNPPIEEPGHNEHFVSLALELTVREKKV